MVEVEHSDPEQRRKSLLLTRVTPGTALLVIGAILVLRLWVVETAYVEGRSMQEVVAESTDRLHFVLRLVSMFALIALLLAMAGIFGTMAYKVSQRRREIGVRVAFGADEGRVVWMVLKEGLLLAGAGIGMGTAMLFAFAIILGSMLYGLSPVNLLYFGGAVAIMAVVALLATAIPALRASRIDPVRALSVE